MKLLKIVAGAAIAVLAGGAIIANAVTPSATLQLKFKVGETHNYRLVMVMSGTTTPQGQKPVPLTETMDVDIQQTVQSVDPNTGAATISGTWQSGTVNVTANGKPVSLGQSGNLQKMQVTTVQAPDGEIKSFVITPPPGSKLPANLNFNGQMFGALFAPTRPVTVGEHWNRETSGGPLGMNYTADYVLSDLGLSAGHQIAHVDSSLNGTLDTILTNPASAHLQGQFDGSQQAMLDNTEGTITSVTGTSHITWAMDVTMPANAAGGQAGQRRHVAMDMTQQIKLNLIN
jgi:hypothetical protein